MTFSSYLAAHLQDGLSAAPENHIVVNQAPLPGRRQLSIDASSLAWPGQARSKREALPSSFEGKAAKAAQAEEEGDEAAEADAEQASADLMAYSAREHAIHEAWRHSERSNELSKEAAELALQSAYESAEARRLLDEHDIIAIENQTQVDVRKAEAARGLEESCVPLPLLALPTTPGAALSMLAPDAPPKANATPSRRWLMADLKSFV
mmetsp:Transcript_88176/g.184240  ORF Transcript_88176/g.184240 Transcript_88176/m.184240 type:complete len:208 (-) Transcript_88176:55-678(-)